MNFEGNEPVPLASAEAPCFFRKRMIDTLEAEKRPFRMAFTTASLDGLWAAVAAGLGVTLRVSGGDLPDSVRPMEAGLPMPPDPFIDLCLHSRPGAQPAIRRLREAVLDTAGQHLTA
jgi:DNA-binding transcriptional LysR family regulator